VLVGEFFDLVGEIRFVRVSDNDIDPDCDMDWVRTSDKLFERLCDVVREVVRCCVKLKVIVGVFVFDFDATFDAEALSVLWSLSDMDGEADTVMNTDCERDLEYRCTDALMRSLKECVAVNVSVSVGSTLSECVSEDDFGADFVGVRPRVSVLDGDGVTVCILDRERLELGVRV